MTDDPRRDPDALLAMIRQDEHRDARGRLRIYFGASAGVGKTFAMLQAARKLLADGTDVLIGVAETHGRAETAELLHGLPVLPPVLMSHRGRQLPEFDLDGALARHPALVLVDELAHSNVAGSRHPKRWQDVEELLAAGIDVYSTLNVQHLESLNDVVGGITGIVVQETLPDTFFDAASEVVLVDTPVDELIQRLGAGKVYLPAQAERAASNFFRRGNLLALRELALRRTADRVEDDVQSYRSNRAISPVWKTEGGLLCCIGPGPGAEQVVRGAAQLARQLGVGWHAVHVDTPALQRLDDAQRERNLRAIKLAQNLGADVSVIAAHGVASALVGHARKHNLSRLVMGHAQPASGLTAWWPRRLLGHTIGTLAPDIDRFEIGLPDQQPSPPPSAGDGVASDVPKQARRYLLTVALCLVTALLCHQMTPFFDLANIVMVFLLSVVGAAMWLGRGPAVLAAFINVAAFDFFFVLPRLSFAVTDAQYLLTFVIMLVVGLVTGQLTAGLRFQLRVATHRESRSRALFKAARDLSNVLTPEHAIDVTRSVVGREFRAEVAVFVMDAEDRLRSPAENDTAGLDVGTAQWVLDHHQPAGLGTDTLAGSPWLYLPLKAPMRTRGVLAVRPAAPTSLLVPEQRQQLETFAALTAMALERLHFSDVAQTATVQMASERLRNSLLAALSHDLRTPLAALVGMAETLVGSRPVLGDAQQTLAKAISERSMAMADMVTNLLDMARIQSGDVRLRRDWQSVEELIGGAVKSARATLGPRPLGIRIADGMPLVECDAVLVERVLANLLENAGKYTPEATPITVQADTDGSRCRISVIDEGPGVPAGRDDAIFEKFTRGDPESATPGVGLGLAICKAIVEAHGGHIGVSQTVPHGATFTFTLPLGTPPPLDAAGMEPGPAR